MRMTGKLEKSCMEVNALGPGCCGSICNEVFMGQTLKEKRDHVVITTRKGGVSEKTKKVMEAALDKISKAGMDYLKRFQTGYSNLYQLHMVSTFRRSVTGI